MAATNLGGQPRSVFFDVDDTLITWDHRLRPHASDVIVATVEMGFDVYIWSGAGIRWEIVDVHNLRPFVRQCFEKPLSRHRERLRELNIPLTPDHVVDDDEEIVGVFGGTHVAAPLVPLYRDDELLRVLSDLRRRFFVPNTGGS